MREAAGGAFTGRPPRRRAGIEGGDVSREDYDRMDLEMQEARAVLKVRAARRRGGARHPAETRRPVQTNKATYERLEGILTTARQAAMGLQQRLAPFRFLCRVHEAGKVRT